MNIKKGIAINSAHLGSIANKPCFETGCFVYQLNVFRDGNFQMVNIVMKLIK